MGTEHLWDMGAAPDRIRGQARLLVKGQLVGIPWQSRGGDLALCCWGELGSNPWPGNKDPKAAWHSQTFKKQIFLKK